MGNHTGIGIYNNASDGSVIRVYGINYEVGTGTIVYFKMIQGIVGSLYTGIGAPGPIDPRTPAQNGQLYTWATAAGQGNATGGANADANILFTKSPGWPLAIIPPGYTWGLESNGTNLVMLAGFDFLSVYE